MYCVILLFSKKINNRGLQFAAPPITIKSMIRRNENQRPLCQAENNTCTNLATYKEMRGNKRAYHSKCGKHRRSGHATASFRNPRSKRYLPLDRCVMCNNPAEERHRIVQGSEYTAAKVLGLCRPCHLKIHKLYAVLSDRGYTIA